MRIEINTAAFAAAKMLSILRKARLKDKELRILMLYFLHPSHAYLSSCSSNWV